MTQFLYLRDLWIQSFVTYLKVKLALVKACVYEYLNSAIDKPHPPKKKKKLPIHRNLILIIIKIRYINFRIIEDDYKPALHEKNNSLQPILLALTGKSYSKSKLATHRSQQKRSQGHMYKCFARNMSFGLKN